MKWRVVMQVIKADGAVHVHEIGGGAAVDEYSPGDRRADAGGGKARARRIASSSRSASHGSLALSFECRAILFQRLFASASELDLMCREFLADGNQSNL